MSPGLYTKQLLLGAKRVTLYLRSSFSMMYPQGPQLYTQCFPELAGGGGGGGKVNSSKMARSFLKPIMQGGSWLCQMCIVSFISQYLF